MSALGHKRTFRHLRFSVNDVRFTPKSGHFALRSLCPLGPQADIVFELTDEAEFGVHLHWRG